ncbi:MAG TPA: tRNA (guanosine(37)-N1)-methyltransferase TrmD [Candidatus Paceibacterota bacterium]|nr:tRNA (guanosine(37)-N1)-methyltransferase TrmD [Candidatus Paceibacterota bacterium]HPT18371.1 tRNA (guanosine(37)-N1)-methyltransferase TrmD [Candidatus Paceibacterota bacterium]
MRFHIITIFPEMFDSYLNESIIGRAIKNKYVSVKFYNPRDFVKDKNKNGYKPVDDKPYGGGPGMVMRAEPILKAVEKAFSSVNKFSKKSTPKVLIINFVPNAEKFTTNFAKKVSKKYTDIILICGRYEGIDARIDKILKTKKISIGDYVLTGGEIPAMILVDCISRQIHGVLGKYESLEEERISSSEVYTRPEILKYGTKKYKVPMVLLSGNHKNIENWKKSKI